MSRLHEDKTFDAVDSAKAHADQLAAKLGRNRSAHEILGRFVRVTDEDGEEVSRAPLDEPRLAPHRRTLHAASVGVIARPERTILHRD